MSSRKETRFFSSQEHFDRGRSWFQQFFEEYDGEKAIGEADPGTMYHAGSARRVHEVIPDACLIFVLRDPVEQVYSHYWFGAERGIYDCQTRSFSEFIRDDENRWTRKLLNVPKYHEKLVRFDPYFDQEQRMVILFENLKGKTDQVMRQVFRFIGVEPLSTQRDDEQTDEKHNVTSYPSYPTIYRSLYRLWKPVRQRIPAHIMERTVQLRGMLKRSLYSSPQEKPTMKLADRAYLQDLYREPNARLAEYLDRDLSHWT
jgi:hypothetical protein